MENTPKTTSNESWRGGRPSFKAYYPEVFLLTLVTIVCIALATKFSCSVLKKADPKNEPPVVSWNAPFLAPLAFAQDDSIGELPTADDAIELPAADDAIELPAADDAIELPAADDSVVDEAAAPEAPTEAAPVDEAVASEAPVEAAPVDEPVGSDANAAPAAPEKEVKPTTPKKAWMKVLWIWIGMTSIPVVLWCWRGWAWICAIFGVRYEIRSDEDNPRASSFLMIKGIFNKTTDTLLIGAIKDIQSSQTLWQKYLMGGVGNITLMTKDLTDGKVVLKNMAEPGRVFRAFDDLRRHYWGKGGMQLGGGELSEGDLMSDVGQAEING